MSEEPPTEQDDKEDDCPICGLSLRFPGLSRFDNETLVCGKCAQSEGTGFMFSLFDDAQRTMLQDRQWQHMYGLTDWQAHCIVIAAINGCCKGFDEKSAKAFKTLRELTEKNKDE